MYKIDKSTWEQMSSNKTKIIKQWMPELKDIKTEAQSQPVSADEVSAAETSGDIGPEAHELGREIIEKAKREAEEIKKVAYTEGYKSGVKKSIIRFEQICEENRAELMEAIKQLEQTKRDFETDLEDKALKLSIIIAEKILNMKIESDDKVFVGMVKNALDKMDEGEKFTLKLNSREYEKHYMDRCDQFREELQCETPITVIKDSTVNAGSFILESEKSFIDAGADTQLSRIADSLVQRDKHYHEAL